MGNLPVSDALSSGKTIDAKCSGSQNGRRFAAGCSRRKKCVAPTGNKLSAGWRNWREQPPRAEMPDRQLC